MNIPRRDYWLARERRAQTSDMLLGRLLWLAALLTVFIGGLHILVTQANRHTPPQLPMGALLGLVIGFFIVLLLWIASLLMRFAEAGVAVKQPLKGSIPGSSRREEARIESEKNPEDQRRFTSAATSQRAGLLALGLFLAGTLGTLLLMTVSHRHEMALIFGGLALVLALLFGVLGWRQRLGKGVVIATLAILVGLGITVVILTEAVPFPFSRRAELQARAEQERATQRVLQEEAIQKAKQNKNESVTALSATNLTFGPVIERVIPTSRRDEACVLDFESGDLLTPPDDLAEKIAKNLQAITGDDQSWMSANSADAAVRPRANNYSLMIFECATVSVDETGGALVWEELTPAKLTAALAPARSFFGHGFFYSDVLRSKSEARVFGFITRERGLGVLQITGFTDNPRGVKIRYKLVQNGASNVASRVGEKAVGSLRLIAGGSHENLAIARTESVIGFSLHEVVARFGGPALTQEQWRLARGVASGPTLAPSTSETMKDDWLPEPVNSMGIWSDYENPTNRQPSSCWFACPNECQLQFALADKAEAAEASRQMNAAFSEPVPLVFGERIPLFRVGEREAWLEVRKINPPAGKLAFINSHLHNAGDVPVAGRSPVQPLGTNRVDSAAITIPPNATLTFTGYAHGKASETNVFSTTLTNSFNQPGLYWLTWRAGSSSSAEADGWEVLIHDARTTQELGHFVSHEPMSFKWRADWSYASTTVGPGETMEKVLLVNDGMTQPGNSRIPFSLLRIKITMQPLVATQKK